MLERYRTVRPEHVISEPIVGMAMFTENEALDALPEDLAASLVRFAPPAVVFSPLASPKAPVIDFSASPASTTTEDRSEADDLQALSFVGGFQAELEAQWSLDGSVEMTAGGVVGSASQEKADKPVEQAKKKKHKSDPNRARAEQRKELLALRIESAELEATLASLKNVRSRAKCGRSGRGCGGLKGSDPIAAAVWKTIAQHQMQNRRASDQEHTALLAAVQANKNAIRRMSKLLGSYNLDRAVRCEEISRLNYIAELQEYQLNDELLQRLMSDSLRNYHQVDNVFSRCTVDTTAAVSFSSPEMHTDEDGNLFSRVSGSKIFPYSVSSTGLAAWTQCYESVRPNARCFFTDILESTADTVIERFGTELHKDGSKVVLHVRQVKRRFIEADRVVVVWQAKVNPMEFEGQRLKGASFDERGYFLIHRPPLLPDGYALLQSCYLISPSTPMRSMPENVLARRMAEFVLSWMTTTIPTIHQIVEDILVDQSLTPGGDIKQSVRLCRCCH